MSTKPFRFTFRKEERLCSLKHIQQLFTGKGIKTYVHFPLRANWFFLQDDIPSPAQVIFPVPKKAFKKANQRNRIRRLVRESYRLQKPVLYEVFADKKAHCIIAISYIAKEKHDFREIYEATGAILQKISVSTPPHSHSSALSPGETI